MAVIQSTNLSGLTTFHELAERLEKSNFNESRVIALIPDTYDVIKKMNLINYLTWINFRVDKISRFSEFLDHSRK